MFVRIVDMREKQVVCLKSGTYLGTVCDVEVDSCNGKIINIVVAGRARILGLFGRCEDIVLPWDSIEVIGRDVMLVNFEPQASIGKRKRGSIFNIFHEGYKN